ncbi:MAG: FHA domain-containing protein [Kofleriaceae bacterium]|nr:FHA domain-containing protein [Kofleriaceae bacterium]
MKTIGVDLWGGQVRGVDNRQTCYATAPSVPSRSMRELFVSAYDKFADLCREVDEPGLALLAVDERTGEPAGLVRLRARFGRHVAAIVGRHDHCDLFLDKHGSLALRHLAIVLEPVKSWRAGSTSVSYRVLDLRTERGFTDEDGKTLRGLRAEGPAFVRCAGHSLFIMPIGDPSDWPKSGNDAWGMLPERVYFDELRGDPKGSLTNMPKARVQNARTHTSMIFRTLGPRDTGMGLVDRGDIAGTLDIAGPKQHGTLSLGDQALRDGVLLGRYVRCDGAALLDDPSLSRVHVLLLHVDDALLAIDTASRNGSHLPGQRNARVIAVERDTELHLGKHTRIRWRWTA